MVFLAVNFTRTKISGYTPKRTLIEGPIYGANSLIGSGVIRSTMRTHDVDCRFTSKRGRLLGSASTEEGRDSGTGPCALVDKRWKNAPKVSLSLTTHHPRRGVASAEPARQVASRQADRIRGLPLRAIHEGCGIGAPKSGTRKAP